MAESLATKEKTERRNSILMYLHSNPNKGITPKQLRDIFNVSAATINRDINFICDNNDSIIKDGFHILFKTDGDRYDFNKTEEGYSDPTAAAVISLETSPIRVFHSEPKAGEVWKVKSSKVRDGSELYIVVAVDIDLDIAICTPYTVSSKESIIKNCHKLYSKPIKYFISKSWGLPLSTIEAMKEELANYLGIKTEPDTEESKSVKRYSEKLYTKEEVDALLTAQKADIYEKCFNALANR